MQDSKNTIKVEKNGNFAIIEINSGTKEVTIAFRGTKNLTNLYSDIYLDGAKVSFANGRVHKGFYHDFQNIWPEIVSNINTKFNTIDSNYTFNFIGHSLGGGIATIASLFFEKNYENNIRLITFGAPACLSRTAAKDFRQRPRIQALRVMEKSDPITNITPAITGINYHPTNEIVWVEKNPNDMPHRTIGYVNGINNLTNLEITQQKFYFHYIKNSILLMSTLLILTATGLPLTTSLVITGAILGTYFIHYTLYPFKLLHSLAVKSFNEKMQNNKINITTATTKTKANNEITIANLKQFAKIQQKASKKATNPSQNQSTQKNSLRNLFLLSVVCSIITSILTYFYFNISSIVITAIIGASPGIVGTYIAAATFGLLIPAAIILSFLLLFVINTVYLYCETKIVNYFVTVNSNQTDTNLSGAPTTSAELQQPEPDLQQRESQTTRGISNNQAQLNSHG
jgi:hypothetical protein